MLKRLYSIYSLTIFGSIFLLLLPVFFVLLQKAHWRRMALWLNHWWARAFFILTFVKVDVVYKTKPDPSKQYIFCPNHFSFIDIPAMGLAPIPFAFVGKISMSKIPLFGYMYRKLHILVDRNSLKSRYETLQQSKKALQCGLSLTIFPEGGIMTKHPPQMASFKTGAFKAAIESKVPVVPVTIPFNYLFLPDDGKLLAHYRSLKIIFHEPIDSSKYEIDELSDLVFNIIASELEKSQSDEGYERDTRENGTLSKAGSG